MKGAPIVQGVEAYCFSNKWRFHMPGHQGQRIFEEMALLQKNLYAWDVTEVEGMDNLQNPMEIIDEAAKKLAAAMESKKSYFLVNGSTCGILAALWALFEPGDTVLIQRNCHQAVFHGMQIRNLRPVYAYPLVLDRWNLASHVTASSVEMLLDQHPQLKGVVLTSPSYYGICCDLEKIASLCKKKGIPLVVDEAHGAHFSFSPSFPTSAMRAGADLSVCSFHKTLPSLTQTAVLNLGKQALSSYEEKIRYGLRLFQTTSPSYLFLASMDLCRAFMEKEGASLLEKLEGLIAEFREEMRSCKAIHLLQKEDLQEGAHLDWSRLVFHSAGNGKRLMEDLRKKFAIEAEMHDSDRVVCICTAATSKEALSHLAKAIQELDHQYEAFGAKGPSDAFHPLDSTASSAANPRSHFNSTMDTAGGNQRTFPEAEVIFPPYEAQEKPWGVLALEEASEKICSESVVPYPPGVPLIYPGEKLTEKIIKEIQSLETSGIAVLKDKTREKGQIAVLLDSKCAAPGSKNRATPAKESKEQSFQWEELACTIRIGESDGSKNL